MLQPKRTKFRREQKGVMKGNAQRGNQLAFGSFGIKTLENCWLTAQQIEAARQAITRRMNRCQPVWVTVREILRVSFALSPRDVSSSRQKVYRSRQRERL